MSMQNFLKRSGIASSMRLVNARFGFATNSSSSHSIIVCEGIKDYLPAGMEYGWGDFTLASRVEKAKYIGMQIYQYYTRACDTSEEDAIALARMFMDLEAKDAPDQEFTSGYIDHESVMSFPVPRLEEQGMAPIWNLLRQEIVERDDIVILGGNDNSDGHPLQDRGPEPKIFDRALLAHSNYGHSTGIFRFDDETGHFSAFVPSTGTRYRYVAQDKPDPISSTMPELVDLKLTDYCTMGCDYCYMNSTPEGKHANTDTVIELARSLGKMGVFEVAIGGGEPTDHPAFTTIIKEFADNGVIPSFSTQSWRWLEDSAFAGAVAEHCGAVALSTQNPAHVRPWMEKCKEHGIRAHFHYVLGLSPLENLKAFLEAWGNPIRQEEGYDKKPRDVLDFYDFGKAHIVLLAHKSMGRAESCAHPYEGWGEVVKTTLDTNERRWAWTIAVDSFLTNEVPKELSDTDPRLYETGDGLFSMFIDAVEMQVGAHSFVPKGRRLSLEDVSRESLKDSWDEIRKKAQGALPVV